MTIVEYLDKNTVGTRYIEHGHYIEVLNNLITYTEDRNIITIDKCLDVHGNCHISHGDDVVVESTLNVKGVFDGNYYYIIIGSFIGMYVIDIRNKHIDKMYIHGYVMNNGVLS